MREPIRRLIPLAVLATMIVALFGPVLGGSRGLSAAGALGSCCEPWARTAAPPPPGVNIRLSDQYLYFEPNEEFTSRWVRRGVWPLWNPDIAQGLPTVAGIQNAEYYPVNLLLWPLPPFWTRGPRAILRITAAFVGTYGFGRALGIARAGATFAALLFAFCGFNIVWLGYPVTNVSVLLPLILWTLERTLQAGTFRWPAGLALVGGAALLGGHSPTVLHVSTVVVAWLAYRLVFPAHPRQRLPLVTLWWRLAVCAVAALLIGSAALLPWLAYVAQNLGEASTFRPLQTLSWKALVVWVVPKFYGDPISGLPEWGASMYGLKGWENYLERTGYVGIAGLLLAAYALVDYRPRHALLPWMAALVATAVFVYDPPALGTLARALPGFAIINNSKMIGVGAFALAMLAGLGCDAVFSGRTRLAAMLGSWTVTVAALAALVAILWPDAAQRQWLTSAGTYDGLVRDVLWSAVPAVAVLVTFIFARRSYRTAALAVLFTATALDLWRFGAGFNPMIREGDVVTPTAGIEYLRQHGSGGRVLPLGVRLLPGNTMLRYGVPDVRGGDWINVHHYEFLVSGRSGAYDFGKYLTEVPSSVHALNVSRALVAETVQPPEGVQPLYDGEFRILDVNGLPRALLVHEVRFVPGDADARELIVSGRVDLRRTAILAGESPPLPGGGPHAGEIVRITRESPNELALTVEAQAPGYLVVNDTFFPGWRCEVDGSPRDITRANVAFRAVPIDAGPHEVVFRYRPWRALVGLTLAASTVIGIAGIGIARALRARRRPPPR